MGLKNILHSKSETLDESASKPLILASNLGIKYEGEKRTDFISLVHGMFTSNKYENIDNTWALRGVSFTGYPGEVLGIIGPNGAGKTTLCRAILGLMMPDMGSVKVRGEVSSLLSLGTGFNQEISGRENIVLNGMMLGLSRKKLDSLLPSIEEFTGLGHFLKYPLKYYSSGMKARLGFSIVVSMEPEIMVIDEVLGTGDLEFKDRAVKKIYDLVQGSKMVIVVTHDISFVENNCTRALWLDKGLVVDIGDPGEVARGYRETVSNKSTSTKKFFSHSKKRTGRGTDETIKVNNLGIEFKLGGKPFWALQDVSFSVHDKEILGIIGPNGAGKSTLCRALSGIYRPDRGSVQVKGDITALLSFGLAFNNLLSGYDNIYLNGMMLGIPKNYIRKIENSIVDFAELEKDIHRPVNEYSSGMKSRLGFSIAAMLKPDIFIVDEALSAGDMAFGEKAANRMQEMLEDAKTVVLVTHSLNIVEKLCTRAIWLHQGTIRYDGQPDETVARYTESVERYRNMRKKLPAKDDARLLQAAEQFRVGNYEIAEALLEESLLQSPRNIAVLTQYAIIAEAREEWPLAKKRWEKVIQAADLNEEPIPLEAQEHLEVINQKL